MEWVNPTLELIEDYLWLIKQPNSDYTIGFIIALQKERIERAVE